MTMIRLRPAVLNYCAAASLCLVASASAGDPQSCVWPKPQSVSTVQGSVFPAATLDPAGLESLPVLAGAFEQAGVKPTGKLAVKVLRGDAGKKALAAGKAEAVPGAYVLEVRSSGVFIAAADEAGVFYASQTLAQMIAEDGKLVRCRVADWPDMPFRGSIEGFYGKPWEHERRLSQIRFYGKYKMNAYIYGPKDDPYSGFGSHMWRDPYPEPQARQISELVEEARSNHVNFIWALHPGSSIRWHDKDGDGTPDDVMVAMKKLEAMYALGVRAFAVFFDDIGGEGAKAEMQARMLNRINRDFIRRKPDVAPLLMCPTDYAGTHGSAYKKQLGAALDKDINIMWTGPGICSDIPAPAVKEVSAHWQRKPFIWWNWPVNDYCRTHLLMGRTYGLDKGNKGLLSGFASNPMDKPEASKVGLFGVADWSWNVDAFDSGKSWRASFPRLFPQCAGAMFVFAQHNSDQGDTVHRYRREESVSAKPAVDKAMEGYRKSGKLAGRDAAALAAEFRRISAAAEKIAATLPESDPALWHEIEFWVKSFRQLGEAGAAAVVLASGRAGDGAGHMRQFSRIATAKLRQRQFSAAQKQRHFEETFESDKRNSKGCEVATRVITPAVDELLATEWKKAYGLLGGKASGGNAVYRAFSTAAALKNVQAEREGIYVSLKRVLEVVKLAPGEHIGLALPEGVFANYIHIKLDNAKAAAACKVEVSTDGKTWQEFSARRGGGEIQNPVDVNRRIRYFRMANASPGTVSFRIGKFKFDVPADAKANTLAATADGDPLSHFTISKATTFTGPKHAKAAYLVTDAPEDAVRREGNTVTLTPAEGGTLHLFEIIWR